MIKKKMIYIYEGGPNLTPYGRRLICIYTDMYEEDGRGGRRTKRNIIRMSRGRNENMG